MILHRLSNGRKRISKLLVPLQRCLSDKTFNDVKDYPGIADILNPENQLAALEPTYVLQAPSSLIDQVPFLVQKGLDLLQVSSGIPWPVVLIGFGVGIRFACLPAHIVLEKRIMDRLPLVRLEMEALVAYIGRDSTLSLKKSKEAEGYRKEHGFSSSAMYLGRYLLPAAAICCLNYISLSQLIGCSYAPLMNSSFLWLPSLCLRDPHTMLSFLNSILLVMIGRKYIRSLPLADDSNWLTSRKSSFALLTFIGMAAQAHLPSGLLLYWLSSNLTWMLINEKLLTLDFFRRSVGLVSYEEKVKLYTTLPKPPENRAVQISSHEVAPTAPSPSNNNELASLWDQGDLGALKEVLSSERTKHDQQTDKLKEDIEFCDKELSDSSDKSKLFNPDLLILKRHLKAEKRFLKKQIDAAKDQSKEFDFVERKLSIAERKQKKDVLDAHDDYNEVKKDLDDTHSELIECLEQCEKELYTTLPSSKLHHYEKFLRRKELLDLQKSLLRDLKFYEDEILALPKEDKTESFEK